MSSDGPSPPARVVDPGRFPAARCRRNRAGSVAAVAAVVPILVAGCGQGSVVEARSTDSSARPSTESGSVEPGTSESPPESAAGADADGSMGVDAVQWPGDIAGVTRLFARMPSTLAGMPRRQSRFGDGRSAGIVYGRVPDGATAWVESPDREVREPTAVLAVMFGLGLACEKGTYAGTAPPSRWGGGPDIDRDHRYDPDDGAWWFSCTIDGAEGDPDYTGHAVGWVGGELAWLTVAPDERTSRALTAALIAAR